MGSQLLDEGGRCLLSGLLPDQCGCERHRNSEVQQRIADVQFDRFTDAMFDGKCALSDEHRIEAGDRIGKVEGGWACNQCVRDVQNARRT